MRQYLSLMQNVLDRGDYQDNRTGTRTISVFGRTMRFCLLDGFPILTTKKVHFKSVLHELLWFISGDTNTKYLTDNGVTIWNEWADENGNLGPVYGYQWRKWPKDQYAIARGPIDTTIPNRGNYIDQLSDAIYQIETRPNSRRIIVSAWNPNHLPIEHLTPQANVERERMALAPCHMMFHFNVDNGYLDILMYQRSVDVFLGLPFNIASYATLLAMIAQVTGLVARDLVWVGGDVHIYENHIDQVKLQLTRTPKELPRLAINDRINSIDKFKYEDISLVGYHPDPHIKAEISV